MHIYYILAAQSKTIETWESSKGDNEASKTLFSWFWSTNMSQTSSRKSPVQNTTTSQRWRCGLSMTIYCSFKKIFGCSSVQSYESLNGNLRLVLLTRVSKKKSDP